MEKAETEAEGAVRQLHQCIKETSSEAWMGRWSRHSEGAVILETLKDEGC